MSKIKLAREKISLELIEEISPLIYSNWYEVESKYEIPLDIDWNGYFTMDQAGMLLPVTARLDGVIVGYCMYLIAPSMHYRQTKMASTDVMFVDKTTRSSLASVCVKMTMFAEETLKSMGVCVMQQTVKSDKDFGRYFDRMGYEFTERFYQKRIA